NGSNGLQEAYLPCAGFPGDPWYTQSLSVNYGTPATSVSPIVLLHPDTSGVIDWASVYTVDSGSGDLQETWLPNTGFPGDPWNTQNLSNNYGTPPTN
ncbi:MAG TPA: hypothetical protein VEJ84_02645, partial [Acidimicrobiales bacterium]|nr:hypothetical protein [Acidimicrobiales bacterium]